MYVDSVDSYPASSPLIMKVKMLEGAEENIEEDAEVNIPGG